MRTTCKSILLILLLFSSLVNNAQNSTLHYFSFEITNKIELSEITKYISIDDVKNNTVYAYANEKEWQTFLSWGYVYNEIVIDNSSKVLNMATTTTEMSNWDRYPTYEVYVQMMQDLANDYPQICSLEEIGTLASGRKLLALKISDNVNNDNEAEPELLYTSTMHGDEATGFVLLIRLADYMLSNYNNSAYPIVNNLINNSEIWLNPNANPDGTYKGGNSTVSGSQRYNNSGIDLNRNFPQPNGTDHPDGNSWAEETVDMLDFAENHHFTFSANFHGGAEVLNYPWDTWSALAVDDEWWKLVCREYATLAQNNSPSGYMTGLNNGITNGFAWYQTFGSRQDYMNFEHNCREVTIEISGTKLISSDLLDDHWNYNRDALLALLTQGLYGVQGVVTDGQGNPLDAKVFVENHDNDAEQSWVKTDARAGDYYRYLNAGTYDITFSADGFVDKTIEDVVVADGQKTTLNVALGTPEPELQLNFNELTTQVVLDETKTKELVLSNIGYADLSYYLAIEDAASNPWITLNATSGTISSQNSKTINIQLNAAGMAETTYSCNILITGDSTITIPVSMEVYTRPLIQLSQNRFDTTSLIINQLTDSLIIQNMGNADLNYTIEVKDANLNPWISIDNSGGTLEPSLSSKTHINLNPEASGVGFFSTKLLIGGDIPMSIPISFRVDTVPYFSPVSNELAFFKLTGESETKNITLKNIGGGTLNYNSEIAYSSGSDWLSINNRNGQINSSASTTIDFTVDCESLSLGEYSAHVTFRSDYDTIVIPVNLTVDTLPTLRIDKNNIELSVFKGNTIKDTIKLQNLGGGTIDILANIQYTDGSSWIIPVETSYNIDAYGEFEFIYTLDSRNIDPGLYNASLSFSDIFTETVNVTFEVIANPELGIDIFSLTNEVNFNSTCTDTVYLENVGGGLLDYSTKITFEEGNNWAQLNKTSGQIEGGEKDTILVTYNASTLSAGKYSGRFVATTTIEKRIPISLTVRSEAQLVLSEKTVSFELYPETNETKTVTLTNIGESTLEYMVDIPTGGHEWLNYDDINGELEQNQSVDLNITATAIPDLIGSQNNMIPVVTNAGNTFINVNLDVLVGLEDDEHILNALTYPNPFKNEITFYLNKGLENSKLVIYNLIGNKIVELIPVENTSKQVVFKWNGKNNNQELPKGIYIYRIIGNDGEYTGRINKY